MSKSTNPRLELAKAINTLVSKQEAFTKAYENLQNFSEETLKNLDLQIETKNTEMKELDVTAQNKQKNLQIEVDQNISEYKYKAVTNILNDRNEVAIDKEEYEFMKKETETLKEKYEREINELKITLGARHKKEMDRELCTRDLTHKANLAEVNARVEQQTKEIDVLQNTIQNLKVEIAEQRKLTAQVAESSRPQMHYGNNGNGKN